MRSIRDLPSPAGHWLWGHAPQVRQATFHQTMEAWAREVGPFFRVRFGPRKAIVLADHALLSEALRQRPTVWQRNPSVRMAGREMGLPGGLFTAEGEAWKVQRRMAMAAFSPENIRRYFPQMALVTERLQNRWLKAAREGRELNLQPELMRYTVDTIAGLALGEDINTLEAGEDVIQQHLDKVLPAVLRRAMSLVPYWRWYKKPVDRELDASVAVINREVDRFVQRARAEIAADSTLKETPRNLLQAMLKVADAEGPMQDTDVNGNVLTMLLAGEDTTANTLAWAIELLHRHPQALARCQAEACLALQAAQGHPSRYTPAMLDGLPYIEACMHETMRLKPVAPFLGLQALQDTTVGDVLVPAGTVLLGLFRHDSVREEYFPSPQAFQPERWLGEVPSSAKRVAMPFGAGPRICPGRYLALLEMKLAMGMLCTGFDIAALRTPDGQPAREQLYFTMAPEGLHMTLRERTNL